MHRTTIRRFVRAALESLVLAALSGCYASPITSARIEASIAPTFANLVQAQVSSLGLPAMAASEFRVLANCRNLAGNQAGSGEWTCTLVWQGPERQTLRDAFDLFVATDGCYMATAAGESLGG